MFVAAFVPSFRGGASANSGGHSRPPLFDRRIILGVLITVVRSGLASSFMWYTYLTTAHLVYQRIACAGGLVGSVALGVRRLPPVEQPAAASSPRVAPAFGSRRHEGKAYAARSSCMLLLPLPRRTRCLDRCCWWFWSTIYLQNSPSQVLYSYVAGNRLSRLRHASSLNSTSQPRYCAQFRSWW